MKIETYGNSLLFLSREGERLGHVQVWRIVKAAAKRAGLSWNSHLPNVALSRPMIHALLVAHAQSLITLE